MGPQYAPTGEAVWVSHLTAVDETCGGVRCAQGRDWRANCRKIFADAYDTCVLDGAHPLDAPTKNSE
jgi:hypothetical protein